MKAKTIAKKVLPRGPELQAKVLETMRIIAEIVGGTLGPGGQQVLIERSEELPPVVTKDGVTVFRSLGFEDAFAHSIMETARDAAERTGNEAGDGTTTATVLAEAIVRRTMDFCKSKPDFSPHRVIREIERCFREQIEPLFEGSLVQRASLGDEEGRKVLLQTATVSANGDADLAEAVMLCFDICGDAGNVTLLEAKGHSGYDVEEVKGYPLPGVGYEDSQGPFYLEFLNQPGSRRTVLDNPCFCLYHGKITHESQLKQLALTLSTATSLRTPNVVVVATEWSEEALASAAANFGNEGSWKFLPIRAPIGFTQGSQLQLLEDLAAVTGAVVIDNIQKGMENATLADLGLYEDAEGAYGSRVKSIEVGRIRSTIFRFPENTMEVDDQIDQAIINRVSELESAAAGALSQLEAIDLRERVARLSGGIARLTIWGPSNAETKEKRDRADDAICAVRGAIKHGVMYGGGWGLLAIREQLDKKNLVIREVLAPSLVEPAERILRNIGFVDQAEIVMMLSRVALSSRTDEPVVYDALELQFVDPRDVGLYDSAQAVLEALRNSLSIATLLGTLGGLVVIPRDREVERRDAMAEAAFRRGTDYVREQGIG